MNSDPRGGPYGTHRPPGTGHRPGPAGRRGWYLAIAAVTVLGLTGGGAALLLAGHGAPKRQLASGCGLINCGASLPSPGVTASTQSQTGKAHASSSHAPAGPKQPTPPSPSLMPSQVPTSGAPAPTPGAPAPTSAAPVPTPAAPAPTNVTVSFTPDQDRHNFGHFQDQMTLMNQGGSPVSGWTVQLTLPGDGVDSVDSQGGWDGGPFEHWQFSGDTLTISADTDSETLGPGAPLNLSIQGRGDPTSPTGCTFNGAACTIQDQWQPDGPNAQSGQSSGPDQPSQPGEPAGPGQPGGQQTQQQGGRGRWPGGQQDQRSGWRGGQQSWGGQPSWGWRR
jgi:hypothetical protein